jgi:hypothetical protein
MPALRILAATTTPLLIPLAPAKQDQPIIFAFDVRITLSDLAAERLRTTREGIVVSAYYTGDPLPPGENRANQIGTIDLGTRVQPEEPPTPPADQPTP